VRERAAARCARLSAFQVAGPTMPSAVSPLRACQRFTAAFVSLPKTPSGVWPSQSWILATREPREPFFRTSAASAGAAAASSSAAPIRSAVSLAIRKRRRPSIPGRRPRRSISGKSCLLQDFLQRRAR
jgi:hypothetical protein